MMIMLGLVLGVLGFELFYYLAKKKARATKSEWYPEIKGEKIKYVDVGNLTLPQAQVLLEDVKTQLKNSK